MNASELVKRITFSKAYEFLDRDPERNFLKLVDWLEKLDKSGFVAKKLPLVRKYAGDPSSNWYQLALRFWKDVDDESRKTLFTNFVINGSLLENQKIEENRKRYGCNIPWVIAMEASGGEQELSFDDMDNIVEQGKELGVYFFVFCGGDALKRAEELIALSNKNSECVFLCHAESGLIDDALASEILRVHNLVPIVAVNGVGAELDAVYGAGANAKLCEAMEILRRHKLPYGVTCQYHAGNCEQLCSEAFFDQLAAWGAKLAWFSARLPLTKNGDPAEIISPAQRELMCRRIREFRQTKPLLTMNQWTDGGMTGGCIAAGRGYFMIDRRGEALPCAYLRYADSNIHSKSLLEILRSPLFMAFYGDLGIGENPLRTCLLLDYPDRLRELLRSADCHPTEGEAQMELDALCRCCGAGAAEWAEKADGLRGDAAT
jgi:MoaA/NifB/PqqE/SkfB family radical SAM enzyme